MSRKGKSKRMLRKRAEALHKFKCNSEWMGDFKGDALVGAIFRTAFNMGWAAKNEGGGEFDG